MEWLETTKANLQTVKQTAEQKSVSDLGKVLGHYRKLESKLVDLLVDLQATNKRLECIVVEKKSISATG